MLAITEGNREQIEREFLALVLNKNEVIDLRNYKISKRKFKRKTKQFIYEIVTYAFAKTKVLFWLKKPKTAYGESRDIPSIKKNWDN